ncbi:hypothetical protein JTB14_007417 [Gonioctena quinquepunctata]|nr:hypothetical protein JTB14_007417 [Gonioctena quinquepunctata]
MISDMNMLVGIYFLFLMIFVNACEKYTTKYDNVDYEEVLRSERLMKNYLNCLLDEGPCSPDGQELKNVLLDSLNTECCKCSDRQKNGARKVIHYLVEKHKDWWEQLTARYDPNGVFKKKYEKEWEEEGLILED